jgi:hypothetical protein
MAIVWFGFILSQLLISLVLWIFSFLSFSFFLSFFSFIYLFYLFIFILFYFCYLLLCWLWDVIKFSGLPSIGFVQNMEKTQEFLFKLCARYHPKLSGFQGVTLSSLVPLHGPPVYKGAEPCPPC